MDRFIWVDLLFSLPGIADLVDLDVGPSLLKFEGIEDDRGYVHPDFKLLPSEEPFFTRELRDIFGRAREFVHSLPHP